VIEQYCISALSLGSIVVAYWPKRDWRRYSCLLGLAAQPLWVHMIVTQELWGLLPIAPAYTLVYIVAVWNNWGAGKWTVLNTAASPSRSGK
jgi:hypothetical protein